MAQQQQVDPTPVRIPPPGVVTVAAVLVLLEAIGLVVIALVALVSGFRHHADTGQLLAQAGYYVALALVLTAVARALLVGRRWGRTPAVVTQIVAAAVGVWLIAPSGRWLWGIGILVLAAVTAALLVSRPANAWIARFPRLYGPAQDR